MHLKDHFSNSNCPVDQAAKRELEEAERKAREQKAKEEKDAREAREKYAEDSKK